jgi:hypothetical protein
LTNLTALEIRSNDLITDAGVIAVANGNLTSLSSMNIANCRNITDRGVDTILRRFPDLDIIR